jgi:hypothetical protein
VGLARFAARRDCSLAIASELYMDRLVNEINPIDLLQQLKYLPQEMGVLFIPRVVLFGVLVALHRTPPSSAAVAVQVQIQGTCKHKTSRPLKLDRESE